MFYLIGGAPRSGKTLLSKRLWRQRNIPFFPIDYLIYSLKEGAPEYGVNQDLPFIDKSEKLWNLSEPLLNALIFNEEEYLVEGDALLPKHAALLKEAHPDIRPCFLGYTNVDESEKLRVIREFGQGRKDDWTNKESDDNVRAMIKRAMKYSVYLRDECSKLAIPYFDMSEDFTGMLERVFAYLTDGAT